MKSFKDKIKVVKRDQPEIQKFRWGDHDVFSVDLEFNDRRNKIANKGPREREREEFGRKDE